MISMNMTLAKTTGIIALALMIPLTATTANAAQAPQSVTGQVSQLEAPKFTTGLVAKTTKPESIKVAGRRHRGAGLAFGIIAGVAAAAIVTGAARAHHRHHYHNRRIHVSHRHRHRHRCRRWAYACDHGYRRACYRYNHHCY